MPTLADIAALLGCPAPPNAATHITGVNSLRDAGASELSFLSSDAYLPQFQATRAAAVLVQSKVKLPPGASVPAMIVPDADLAVSKVLTLLAPPTPRPPAGIDPLARVHPSAALGAGVAVGPFVVIGANVRIAAHTVIHAGVFIGDDVSIGERCEFFPNVVIRERITIGARVTIHSNSALGTDGFGYRWDGRQHAKIPQIGAVIIEDDVEIGSCVCIDRAKFGATRVGRGTKIDNLVQVAHNVTIGPYCILVGQSGLAGSVQLGAGVVIGGQVAVRDHITMGDGAMAAACSGIAEDVDAKAIVSGTPALPHRQTLREQAALRHLPELRTQVRKLQEALDELQKRM
jgi:UDP-3-O-[3-hydroxymyristoyl] glucosamine N-acyltransferase